MEAEQLIARVQELTGRLEDLDDPACRELAEELTAAVVQMYGAGLERIVELADEGTRDEMAKDDLVSGLLMIHDLYPVPLEERVTQALDTVRPYMESHGGNVELLGIENGIAKLRLEGSCKSCRASSSTLELAVRQALEEAAPDLDGMDVEGIVEEAEEPEISGIPLPIVQVTAPARLAHAGDRRLRGARGHRRGGRPARGGQRGRDAARLPQQVRGLRRRRCDGGALDGGALGCPGCGRNYFLPQAGRSMDDDHLQLQPVPLLREQEEIKVAL